MTLGAPAMTRLLFDDQKIPFDAVCEPTGAAHEAFGLKRARFAQVVSWAVIKRGLSAFRRGFRQGLPKGGNAMMLPGVFAVDAAGDLVLVEPARDVAAHIPADEILARLVQRRTHG